MAAAGVLRIPSFRPRIATVTAKNCFLGRRTAPIHSFPSRFFPRFPVSPIWRQCRRNLRPLMATGGPNQVDFNGNGNRCSVPRWIQSLLEVAEKNFLPLALVSGIALGLVYPELGCLAHRYSLSKFGPFGIFFISGLTLRSREVGAALEAWPVGLLGLGSILLVTPFFSRLILHIKLSPQEFVTGLAVFCCMPTTLSSGVALTQLVGGNSALALAMTVMSNLLGILVVPFTLSKFIGAAAGISIPTSDLFRSLVVTLLLPLILGKLLRETFTSEFSWAIEFLVPWMQVSKSRPLLLVVQPAVFAIAIGMGMLLHILLLALNFLTVQSLSILSGGSKSVFLRKENARAVIIVASQKTLPVMVAVLEKLGRALGEPGLIILPCVASHINQIIIDSFLVNYWLQRDQHTTKAQ